mmetsp:Transcript_35182/g.109028  ORF Transcript_35182/g.109028 Transcript_35182/m.109028 type:complete len:252 (-) Transcript_35182:557-1312(-)
MAHGSTDAHAGSGPCWNVRRPAAAPRDARLRKANIFLPCGSLAASGGCAADDHVCDAHKRLRRPSKSQARRQHLSAARRDNGASSTRSRSGHHRAPRAVDRHHNEPVPRRLAHHGDAVPRRRVAGPRRVPAQRGVHGDDGRGRLHDRRRAGREQSPHGQRARAPDSVRRRRGTGLPDLRRHVARGHESDRRLEPDGPGARRRGRHGHADQGGRADAARGSEGALRGGPGRLPRPRHRAPGPSRLHASVHVF